MNASINKNKLKGTIIIVLLAFSSFIVLSNTLVNAQWYINDEQHGMGWWGEDAENLQENGGIRLPAGVTPDFELKTDPYMSFRPNPVGVNQPILVNLWCVPGPSFVRFFSDYKVTISKPDGTQEVIMVDSYMADSTAWFEYIPDQVGTWTLKFDLPGQYFPPGNYTMPTGTSRAGYTDSYTKSMYYKPASTEVRTLTVQEDMVYSWPESELPTDYWTRPVAKEHREWWTILGDYPWRGPSGGPVWDELYPETSPYYSGCQRFTPWVQGPESGHVVWKQLNRISGIYGGDNGYYSMSNGGGTPNIVYQGRAYHTITKPFNGETQSVWTCYDIRTGEVFWERIGVSAPSYIEYEYGLPSVPGAEASTRTTATLVRIGGNRLQKFNPETGAMTLDRDIPSFSTTEYYRNGYALSVQTLSSTGGPGEYGTPSAGIYRLINWTTAGTSSNFNDRIISNITWPRSHIGNFAQMRDYESGIVFRCEETSWFETPVTGFPYAYIPFDNASGIRYGTRIAAYSLTTGQLLWDKDFYESVYHPTASAAQHGKLAILMQDSPTTGNGGYYMCFDSYTGNLLWKSEQMDSPWDICGFGSYSICSAYGMFYRFGYSGVYAFDWDDGSIVWKYEAPAFSSYETPYTDEDGNTMYSWNGGGYMADGKIYSYNTEHTPTQPLTRGWGIHCMDAKTGELVWKTKIWGTIGPIADGYLTASGYDGYTYAFGKGESETTVATPDIAVPKGTAMTIKGTVLDLSPAQSGTPCVSVDSMSTQMEYLHLQMPIDGLWNNETITGVPVTLTAIGEDGSYVDVGTVTTDGYSGAFGVSWTPTNEGIFKVIASFEGDVSYGSSSATTFVTVGSAPASGGEIEPEPSVEPLISTELAIVIAVVAAVAIGVVAFVLLRRRE